jgi:hypothetical protein
LLDPECNWVKVVLALFPALFPALGVRWVR